MLAVITKIGQWLKESFGLKKRRCKICNRIIWIRRKPFDKLCGRCRKIMVGMANLISDAVMLSAGREQVEQAVSAAKADKQNQEILKKW